MLPFLKNREEGAQSGPIEKLERKPDQGDDYDMLDAVAEDLLAAIAAKDKGLLKSALASLVDHIQMTDLAQDQEMGE